MAGGLPSNRITIDASELQEAMVLTLRWRNFAPPLVRMAIDHWLEAMGRGEVPPEQLMVCWHEATNDGVIRMHLTPGPLLLELAMPLDEVRL